MVFPFIFLRQDRLLLLLLLCTFIGLYYRLGALGVSILLHDHRRSCSRPLYFLCFMLALLLGRFFILLQG
jgi:hypothetical protein